MGSVGSGKTNAIRTISDIEVLNTDVQASDEVQLIKANTTVAMDVGVLHLSDDDHLRIYGAPGQERFDFMWEILLQQAQAVILLVNHANLTSATELRTFLTAIHANAISRNLPLAIAITHTDEDPNRTYDEYHSVVNQHFEKLSEPPPPIFEMDARNQEDVKAVLLTVVAMLEMSERFPQKATSKQFH